MLLILNSDDWLNVFETAEEAEDYLELQDVQEGEYQVCDPSGQVYEFALSGTSFHIVPTAKTDDSLPLRFTLDFAQRHGFSEDETQSILARYQDYGRTIEHIERNGKWRRRSASAHRDGAHGTGSGWVRSLLSRFGF